MAFLFGKKPSTPLTPGVNSDSIFDDFDNEVTKSLDESENEEVILDESNDYLLQSGTHPIHDHCTAYLYQDSEGFYHDVYFAIKRAKHHVVLVGWQLNHHLQFLRHHKDTRLIDLLNEIDENVLVYVMLWKDDKNLAGTGNDETEKQVLALKRSNIRFKSFKKHLPLVFNQNGGFGLHLLHLYTHHQKLIICDYDIGFVGGLDIARKRFDNRNHILRDKDLDERLRMVPMPWHDVHARVEGTIVEDLMTNAMERWEEPMNILTKQELSCPSLDPRIEELEYFKHQMFATNPKAPQKSDPILTEEEKFWSVAGSVGPFKCRVQMHRSYEKINAIEKDIVHSYIKAIKLAKHCLYLENQYFIGGSEEWVDVPSSYRKLAPNPIPTAIRDKILEAIDKGEMFRVILVVPNEPIAPYATIANLISAFQNHSIDMIYEGIKQKLKEKNIYENPMKYFSVVSLRARDPQFPTEFPMIYVHSKMMIVDDEYVIIGSANINQRSFSGKRDTELNIGIHEYPGESKFIKNYRKNLIAEHFGPADHDWDDMCSDKFFDDLYKSMDNNYRIISQGTSIGKLMGFAFPLRHYVETTIVRGWDDPEEPIWFDGTIRQFMKRTGAKDDLLKAANAVNSNLKSLLRHCCA